MPKVRFDFSFFLLLFGIILTGTFREFSFFFSILFVHECGHFLMARFFHWEVREIAFYSYGGCTKFKTRVNTPLKEEFWVLIMGPFFQVVFAFFMMQILSRTVDQQAFLQYHYGILIFNLLPIYPLDGGKLCHLLWERFVPYKKSFSYVFTMSFFFLVGLSILLISNHQVNYLVILVLLWLKLFQEVRKSGYYYQRFLMERYLEQLNFPRHKLINEENGMFRDCRHLFYQKGHYLTERQVLKRKFRGL